MAEIPLEDIHIIALDTAPLIYYVEEHPKYLPLIQPIINGIDSGSIIAYTSVITLIEVLIAPIRDQKHEIVREYKAILLNSNLRMIDLSPPLAEKAAEIRAKYNLRLPDSVQIAVAVMNHADLLVGNDQSWKKVSEVKIIVLDELFPESVP